MGRTPDGRRPSHAAQGRNVSQPGVPQNQTQYTGQIPYHQNTENAQSQQNGYGYQIPQQPGFRQTQAQNHGSGLTPAQKKMRQLRKREQLRRRRRHRRLFFAVLFLLVMVVGYFAIRHLNGADQLENEEQLDLLDLGDNADEDDYIEAMYEGPPVATIAFVGDISVSKDQVKDATLSDNTFDFMSPISYVASHISDADYAVGNFETNIVDDLDYGGEPYYNAPVQLAGALRRSGFNMMSTANTYMLNNGIEGLVSTKYYLNASKLKAVGTYFSQEDRDENSGVCIRTIHKIKFAFISYTKGTDAVTMPEGCEYAMNTLYSDYSDYWTDLRTSQIKADIQAAKDAGAEVIIALVHWGSEYSRSVSEPQKTVANLLLQNGVDVIIGTHSHLVNSMGFETVEMADGSKKRCFVAYGLGDFYTDPEQESAQTSVILNLQFHREDDGTVSITDAKYVPIYMYITEVNNRRSFKVLDTYNSIANLKRSARLTSEQAVLYNTLLDSLDTLHNYAGEDLDAGPSDEDLRIVNTALLAGPFSDAEIGEMQEEEAAAEASAKAALEEVQRNNQEEQAAQEAQNAQEQQSQEQTTE